MRTTINGKDILGISINGVLLECEVEKVEFKGYLPKIGDSVAFIAGADVYTGGKVTDVKDGIPWVNGIKLSKDVEIWKVNA